MFRSYKRSGQAKHTDGDGQNGVYENVVIVRSRFPIYS